MSKFKTEQICVRVDLGLSENEYKANLNISRDSYSMSRFLSINESRYLFIHRQ